MITLRQPRALTLALSSGALNLDAAATTYDTTATISFVIDGKFYSKTAVTNGTTPTTDGNTGLTFTVMTANQGCVIVWALNAAGTVIVTQGPVTALDSLSGLFSAPDAPQFPFVPDTSCPFAYVVMKNGSTGSNFTIGSSNWDATGMTTTVVNTACLPARPQTS